MCRDLETLHAGTQKSSQDRQPPAKGHRKTEEHYRASTCANICITTVLQIERDFIMTGRRPEWDTSRVKTRKGVLERQPAHGGKACMLIKAGATMSLTGEKVKLRQN